MKTMQMYDLYEKNNFIKTGEELMRLKKSKIAERHNICRDDEVKSLYLKNKLEHMHLKEFKDIIQLKVEKYACSAMSIFLLLKDKYGYSGGYSSVARYVASFKQDQKVKVTIFVL